jgi:hypothetical protein
LLRVLWFSLLIIPPISPSSKSPGAGTIGLLMVAMPSNQIGLHPPLYQFKITEVPNSNISVAWVVPTALYYTQLDILK